MSFPQRTVFCQGRVIGCVADEEADALLAQWQASGVEDEVARLRDIVDWEHRHGTRESFMAAAEAWRTACLSLWANCRADIRAVEAAREERWDAIEAARREPRKPNG